MYRTALCYLTILMVGCQAPASETRSATSAAQPPDGDSLGSLVRDHFRLDFRTAYEPAGDGTQGTVHVWNERDSVSAPASFVAEGDPPTWKLQLEDPAGVMASYTVEAVSARERGDERWRACRAEGRTALACAARGHQYDYRALTVRRGAGRGFTELNDLDLATGLVQLFDPGSRGRIEVDGERFDNAGRYGEGTGALIYYHAADTLFTWVVSGEGVTAEVAQPIAQDLLTGAVQAFREDVARGGGGRDRAPSRSVEITVGRSEAPDIDVGQILLPDAVASAVEDLTRVIVVPVLNLGTAPFAAIPVADGYLLDLVTLSVSPSLWDLFWQYSGRGSLGLGGTIVGNPDFSGEKEWRMPPLPGAEAEAAVVASLFTEAEVLVGTEATEEAVLRAEGGVLHLATHGIADAEDPLYGSFLALSGGARLTAAEIQEHEGWPKLVVMSACQTGLGMTDLGGVIGLARAFHLAGVTDVVMSLWNVEDEATVELMRAFYSHLPDAAPADALRAAALAVRDRYPSPGVWAAFAALSLQQR